ncbi:MULTISPECIES: ABC transporter substrate-binding protein [Bacillaceae]|uniref:ABC transporter substrate-binding protein n=1 Tax=Evansella alkalicola TaxID=745819 RepID=A0ABS6JQ51_9BACI|nr:MULTISPECIES: ABC transporter substrate-binding protein [Bacillaceae]MBU9720618.1 ABC transporter substrate-binding protein [Bacillus alkalicola]
MKNMIIVVLLLSSFIIAACSNESSGQEKENLSLSIGLMPAVDSAPILLAQEKGYFEELGLELEAKIYTNANNRQSALQAGELDGTMTDLIAYVNNQHNGFDTKIVTSTDGTFTFLAGQNVDLDKILQVGTMEISVANYLTDFHVATEYDIEKIFIAEIPARLEMLNTGQLDLAFIPEPVASMGEFSGLNKLITITDDGEGFMPEAMVFTPEAIAEKGTAIELFIQGYNMAVENIMEDDSEAREVLIKEIELNPEIKELMSLPNFQKARVPSESYMTKIIDWVAQTQEIEINLKYEDMVDNSFIE